MAYHPFNPDEIKARLRSTPRDPVGTALEVFGWLIILAAVIGGIAAIARGNNSDSYDFNGNSENITGGVGVLIIFGGTLYGLIVVAIGRILVHVRRNAFVAAGAGIALEGGSGGWSPTAAQPQAPRPQPQPTPTPTPQPAAPSVAKAAASPTGPGGSASPVSGFAAPTSSAPASTYSMPSHNAPQAPTPSTPTEPGWVADPTRRHEYRYWDGSKYTERVGDQGKESTDPI